MKYLIRFMFVMQIVGLIIAIQLAKSEPTSEHIFDVGFFCASSVFYAFLWN